MEKNPIYFRRSIERTNIARGMLLGYALGICSYPRLILEVFIRKNMGQRYFRKSSFFSVTIWLALLPFLPSMIGFHHDTFLGVMVKNLPYYLFILAFVYFGFKRAAETKTQPSVYDFKKFTKYSGDINPRFLEFKGPDGKPNIRGIEIYLEPLPFFIAGLLVLFIVPMLGLVLVISAIIYSLSYMAAYRIGDEYILDKIDAMIRSEEIQGIFLDDRTPNQARGVEFRGRKPSGTPKRWRLWQNIKKDFDDDASDAK